MNRVRSAEAAPVMPEHFLCPITHLTMEDPCMTRYGYTYERWAIEREVDSTGRDPVTRQELTRADLFPNRALREAIEHYLRHSLRFAVPFRVRAG